MRFCIVLVLAGSIRYLLMLSNLSKLIRDRVEVSTPLNSWKRAVEGAFLFDNDLNPYSGDLYHNSPLMLWLTNALLKYIPHLIPLLFVVVDLVAAICLYYTATGLATQLLERQARDKSGYAKKTEDLWVDAGALKQVPMLTFVAYLFNPYSILNCVGQTMTVWSNLLLAVFLISLMRRWTLLAMITLILETQQNLYPIVLLVPLAICHSMDVKTSKISLPRLAAIIGSFAIISGGISYINFIITSGSWQYLDATFGFILGHRDLQPNIGLFWYFFTEMFDHFRVFFLYTFQMNALVLYLVPLTLKFYREPLFLSTLLIAFNAIFKSYPCIGDVAFYLALLPMWRHVHKYMSYNFIVGCFFLVTSALGPVVWHLWINAASANANFYFGVTLSFATAQIFLTTDLLFAYIKREFYLRNGPLSELDGKEARVMLE